MNLKTKKTITSGFIAGIVYATILAGFDYFEGKDFRLGRFLWNFIFLGIVIGLFIYYSFNKKGEN